MKITFKMRRNHSHQLKMFPLMKYIKANSLNMDIQVEMRGWNGTRSSNFRNLGESQMDTQQRHKEIGRAHV